jgi:GT2 family glycosyltransferase
MSKIFILLPVHNRRAITEKFIACLSAQTFSNYHLILIDDGSIDGTAEMVKSKIVNATVLTGCGDWWWAGSLQKGLDWLKNNVVDGRDIILFINDDVCFEPAYLEQACGVMNKKNGFLVLSRFNTEKNSMNIETGVTADLKNFTFKQAALAEQVNCLSTRGLFIHWEVVKAIGDFYPKLLPHYLSDYEYSLRAYRKGFKCESSQELLITPNHDLTGYHQISEVLFGEFISKYFSKKSPNNPCFWTSFVILTSTPLWIIPNLIRVWKRATWAIFSAWLVSRK